MFVREVIYRRGFNPGIVKVFCGLENGQKYDKIAVIVKEDIVRGSE